MENIKSPVTMETTAENEVESMPSKSFPTTEEMLGPVSVDDKLEDTAELEISNTVMNQSEKVNLSSMEDTVTSENFKRPAKRKSYTSAEVANALFTEFENKLVKTLRLFSVDDMVEMQKTRAQLKNQNEKLKARIIANERYLASAKLAHYLIQNALVPDCSETTDSATVENLPSQHQKEGNEEEAARQLDEKNVPKLSDYDSPTKVINQTVKRLVESSIIKLPANNIEKKPKLDTDFITDTSKKASEDTYTLNDDQLKEFLEDIIKVADEALHSDEYETPKPKQSKNASKNITQNQPSKNLTPVAGEPEKKKATRRSNGEPEKKKATRRSNVKLVNPPDLVHHNCHLCSKGFYKAKELHNHYVSKHSTSNESNGTFGVDVHDEQTSTKCHLCGYVANSANDLIVHKSHHVKPEFCAHKCNKCELKFCLKSELEVHRQICNRN